MKILAYSGSLHQHHEAEVSIVQYCSANSCLWKLKKCRDVACNVSLHAYPNGYEVEAA